MKETIDRLRTEMLSHEAEVKKRRDAIRALQEVCDHDFVPDGHDSHHEYKRCTRCGLEKQA
jgi:hypothetical protein